MTTVPGHDAVPRCVALIAAAEPRCGDTVVVAVDGPSGAGKTTLTRAVRRHLGRPPVVHLDAIYPGWDGLPLTPAILHDRVLAPLARGERAAYRRFDWEAGAFAEEHEVRAATLLLVEGCGAGAWPGFAHVSVLIWVEAPTEVRYGRAIARDGEAYRPNWERWAASERALFRADRTRERADLVVDTRAGWAHPPGTTSGTPEADAGVGKPASPRPKWAEWPHGSGNDRPGAPGNG
jgi:uridine kinase